ncbi:MAG: hypothetical protein GMKNLPBB_02641 [Myxococcota bacterium]|nr:hypothetical protein [Myxococcota bacterium]
MRIHILLLLFAAALSACSSGSTASGDAGLSANDGEAADTGAAPPDGAASSGDAAAACMEVKLFKDTDSDGVGTDPSGASACLKPGDAPPAGQAAAQGDCKPDDSSVYPGRAEVCSDQLDDDCDGKDLPCPETRPGIVIPDWTCDESQPVPSSVLAHALVTEKVDKMQEAACFLFFEALPGEIYLAAKAYMKTGDCQNGFDANRRMAWLTVQDPDACKIIRLEDAGELRRKPQPMSSTCRKFLRLMDDSLSSDTTYVGKGAGEILRRLKEFPTLQIGCAEVNFGGAFQYKGESLGYGPVKINPNFQAMK